MHLRMNVEKYLFENLGICSPVIYTNFLNRTFSHPDYLFVPFVIKKKTNSMVPVISEANVFTRFLSKNTVKSRARIPVSKAAIKKAVELRTTL